MREARIIILFFAMMPLTFMLTTTSYMQSLVISVTATLTMLIVSYISIKYYNQKGDFLVVSIYTFTFFIVAIYMSYLAGLFYKQRYELRKAKILAEKTTSELWGEMELAKKIQSLLLPKNPKIEGFEILAKMFPADMVGGDYYDIINAEGHDWLVIGDVSGHGVPAGLIMMMVQTSIHTVLTKEPDISPSELLGTINTVLRENIKRMSEDKYMTITVFASHKNGQFTFAGLHQDILVFRKKLNNVERIATNGMWIGITGTEPDMYSEDTITLQKGDTMLLYSDGITETWVKKSEKDKRDMNKDMFGNKRLIDIFNQNGNESVDEIIDGLFNALENYQIVDDITIVLLRKL